MPTTVVLAVVLLVGHRRVIGATPLLGARWYLFWVCVAGFLAVTVTPNPRNSHLRTLSLAIDVPGPHQVFSAVDQSGLNALIALPMGLLGAVLATTDRRTKPLVVAAVVPPLAEGVQWLVPALGRVGFDLGDVTANWTGVVLGAVIGSAIGLAVRCTLHPRKRER